MSKAVCQYGSRLPQHQMKKVNNFVFDLYDQIGSGYSSKVYKGKNCVNGTLVAIKVVQLLKLSNEVEKALLANQSRALNVMNHPNILRAFHTMQTTNNFYLVTELYEQNLEQFLKLNGCFNEHQIINFLMQMVDALVYLQGSGIVHRDIKPSNIFVSNGNYVLGDFGFCQFSNSTCQQRGFNVGSPMYMSPQAYRSSIYGSQSDVWALGICVIQLLNGGKPFSQITYDEMILQIHEGKYLKKLNISQKLKELLNHMLQFKFESRISVVDLQRLIGDLETSEIPSINIPNFSMEISPNQKNKRLKNNHRRSASVRFIQNQKQIKFKNAQKRRVSPTQNNTNQQNILSPIIEKKSSKSITVIHPPLTERSNQNHNRQISVHEAPRAPPNPKIIVLEDLSKLLLLDNFLCEGIHKLKLLKFLSIMPSIAIPVVVKTKIQQLSPDYYFNYVIQTVDISRIFQVSHFLTFLLHNAIIQYNGQDISRKVSDQNFCNRINCLQHALHLWGIIKHNQQNSKPCSVIAEPRILDRAKSKSTGNLVCGFVFGKNEQQR